MSTHQLYRHVHVCFIEDFALFLDSLHGKYFALGGDQKRAFLRLITGAVHTPPIDSNGKPVETTDGLDEFVCQQLEARGFITNEPKYGKPLFPVAIAPATRILADETFDRHITPGATAVARAALALTRAKVELSAFSLSSIGSHIQARKQRHPRLADYTGSARTRDLLQVYFRLRPFFFSSQNECLLDSLALVHFLAGYRLFPHLLIGVRLNPFSAHSWVQMDDAVLNDSVEHVNFFTPIFAV
jgi:hypothetical protein